MKRILRIWCRLLAMALTMVSLQAAAAEQPAAGRDFNHMTTGFQLTGAHATAACETCHVGGVFKGTPRDCEGCHAIGRRVVATPKHNAHIVTDAPCESCHFNASTFLGARYNHGTAKPGDCKTCHNGRVAESKHAGHVVTNDSCDQCHRTSTWLPASWNHTGSQYSGQDCSVCHKAGGSGRNYSASHLPMIMDTVNFAGSCVACHTSYYSFYSAFYNHAAASPLCQNCHGTYNTPRYTGVQHPTSAIHPAMDALQPGTACNACHKSISSFQAASYDHVGATACTTCHNGTYESAGIRGKSPGHLPYLANATECSACHKTTTSWSSVRGGVLHQYLVAPLLTAPHTPTCRSCHSGAAHDGDEGASSFMDCSMSGCHAPAGGQGSAYLNWD